jgi:hypothetical protein
MTTSSDPDSDVDLCELVETNDEKGLVDLELRVRETRDRLRRMLLP